MRRVWTSLENQIMCKCFVYFFHLLVISIEAQVYKSDFKFNRKRGFIPALCSTDGSDKNTKSPSHWNVFSISIDWHCLNFPMPIQMRAPCFFFFGRPPFGSMAIGHYSSETMHWNDSQPSETVNANAKLWIKARLSQNKRNKLRKKSDKKKTRKQIDEDCILHATKWKYWKHMLL